jgi:hypothetical protein
MAAIFMMLLERWNTGGLSHLSDPAIVRNSRFGAEFTLQRAFLFTLISRSTLKRELHF